MGSEPAAKTLAARLRLPPRRGSPVASVVIAVSAILLASMGASALWAARTQWESLERARIDQIDVVGHMLAQSAEVMLADNELSALRRIISEAARKYELELCQVTLPDARVVADAVPSRIVLRELPPKWLGAVPAPDARISDSGRISRRFALIVPGRGNAKLEIAASIAPRDASYWPTQAGIGTISVGALAALLVLNRRTRSRLKGISAIRQALLAHEKGQTGQSALEVNPDWGLEAKAWNNLLSQQEEDRKRISLEKTLESLQDRQVFNSDLDAACDAMSQGLILVDRNQRAKYANGAAAVLLRAQRERMLSGELCEFIDDQRVVEAARAATTGPIRRRTIVEVERNDKDGGGLLRFIVRPVRREDSGVAMIIVEDITQQRVAEDARNAFVAHATHELRTPLANIRLYVERAVEEGEDEPAIRADCLNVINQETRRLERMVADILSVAEIDAGKLRLKADDVRLDELFRDLEVDYAAQAKDGQIELAFSLPPKLPVVQADRDKVALGLHNLVGNALKYTPSGGKVEVRVVIEKDRLIVDVSDTGIGISEEDSERIFEKFYRARDPRVAEATGTGLGLSIAREVIRLHGGDITVQSELSKGSTFTLVMPIADEAG